MKAAVHFIAALCVLSGFAGCAARHKIMTTEISDSVYTARRVEYVEVLRDTVIYVPLPAESREAAVMSDSSFLQTSLALSVAAIRPDGRLYHTIENKPGPISAGITLREKQTVVVEFVQKNSRTVAEIPVKEALTVREKFLMHSGVLLWLLIMGTGVLFMIRILK